MIIDSIIEVSMKRQRIKSGYLAESDQTHSEKRAAQNLRLPEEGRP